MVEDVAAGEDAVLVKMRFQGGWSAIGFREEAEAAFGGMYGLEITAVDSGVDGAVDYEKVLTTTGGAPQVSVNQTSVFVSRTTSGGWSEIVFYRSFNPLSPSVAWAYGPGSPISNTWTFHQEKGTSLVDPSNCPPIPSPTPLPTPSPTTPNFNIKFPNGELYPYLIPPITPQPLRSVCYTGRPCKSLVVDLVDPAVPGYLTSTGSVLTMSVSLGGSNGTEYNITSGSPVVFPGVRYQFNDVVVVGVPGTVSFVFTLKENGVLRSVLTQDIFLEQADVFYREVGDVFIGIPLVHFSEPDFVTAGGGFPLTVVSVSQRDIPSSEGTACGTIGIDVKFTSQYIKKILEAFLTQKPLCDTFAATPSYIPNPLDIEPGTHATALNSFLYLQTDNWDTVCIANLPCKTISMRLKYPVPGITGVTCVMTISGGSKSVAMNANETCQYYDLVIANPGVYTVEIKAVSRGYSGKSFKAILTVKDTIDGKVVTPDDVVSFVRVRGGFAAGGVQDEFPSIVAPLLGVPVSSVIVSRIDTVPLVASKKAAAATLSVSTSSLQCSSTEETEVTWKLADTTLSSDPTAYTRFMIMASSPDHSLFQDLCGVSEAFRNWELASVLNGNDAMLSSIEVLTSATVYSYLERSFWLCLNGLACGTIVLKVGNSTEADDLRAKYPGRGILLKAVTDNQGYSVDGEIAKMTERVADGRGDSFVFHNLTFSGPGGIATVRFVLGIEGGTWNDSPGEEVYQHLVQIAEINFEVERVMKTVVRMPLDLVEPQLTGFVSTITNYLRLPVELTVAFANVTEYPIVPYRGQTLSVSSPYFSCNTTTPPTTGTEISWYLTCTLANNSQCPDKYSYYDFYLSSIADITTPLDRLLCGVDQAYGAWYRLVPRTPAPSSSDSTASALWIVLILALLLLCCGVAMFLYGIRKREERQRREAARASYDPEEMGPVPLGDNANAMFRPQYVGVAGFTPPPPPSAPQDPGHGDPNTAAREGSPDVQEQQEEILKLQREIEILENQRGAIDKILAERNAKNADGGIKDPTPAEDDAGVEIGQVGATASQLPPFPPMRITPDGRIPEPKEAVDNSQNINNGDNNENMAEVEFSDSDAGDGETEGLQQQQQTAIG
eukprot:TRINITY_DN25630_c0_g1_i1.p1 TRINITY_DN25630_c0_g1~~TRINITY_DN25630_c0_g1_i1.p1  ORF type:complete len:1182 (+),score=189.02 TRINITY_DN25630_c0_g1_i1:197-3547(+)